MSTSLNRPLTRAHLIIAAIVAAAVLVFFAATQVSNFGDRGTSTTHDIGSPGSASWCEAQWQVNQATLAGESHDAYMRTCSHTDEQVRELSK